MINVALYKRVSTLEQSENGHSLDEQEERMRKYCESFGWNVYDVFCDAGFTGSNMSRPALRSLIKAVEHHQVDKVLVYKLDRLSRSQKDTLNLIEDVFLKNNVDFVSMNENFDTATAFGRAMVGILAVFAQLEREQIKERMQMGREARAKQGKHKGSGHIPVGYKYENGKLLVNDFEAMQVRMIFDMYLSGKSNHQIADYLNSNGYVSHYGKWIPSAIPNIIKRETYLGKIIYKSKVFDGEHEAIIDRETFDKANAILSEKQEAHEARKMRAGRVQSYLGGLLVCGKCGAKMSKRSTASKGDAHHKYCCLSRWKATPSLIKDPKCMNKIWTMTELDEIVFDEIKKLAFESSSRNFFTGKMEKRSETIRSEIKKIDEQLSRVMDLYVLGSMPADILREKSDTLTKQKKKLENELEKVLDEEKSKLSKENTLELINSFSDVLEKGNFEEIRLVIESLIEYIEVDDEDITIHWKFN